MKEFDRTQLKAKKALMVLRERNSRCVRGFYETVLRSLPSDSPSKHRQAVAELTQLSRDIYCVMALDDEVRNGGFNQYFFGDAGHFVQDAIASFARFDEPRIAAVVRQAVEVFSAEHELQQRIRQTGTLEAFAASYSVSKLGEVDDAYFEGVHFDRLCEKMAAAIRSAG